MPTDARRLRRIRGLALLIGALSVIVVAVSAYLRLDAAGLGCADWPACYGGILGGQPPALHYGFARLLHRLAASAALVFACILVWQCLRPLPVAAARPALLLLALMLALSVLGFFSADPRRVLVGFLNIVGGLGLVSFSWRVVLAATPDAAPADALHAPRGLLRAGIVSLSLTVLVGAWLGASYAALACPSLPGCAGGADALLGGWSSLHPLRVLDSAPAAGAADGVLLHLLHRGLAVLTVLLLGGGLLAAALPGGRKGRTPLVAGGLLLAVAALGGMAVASGFSLWLVVGHGVVAALLLAAIATVRRSS